ncbi:zinc transporter ZupT [Anaerosacchariphilus polymeriproducens]|uniref:Zinc transporter ZupT n=1 Tax=Anaerosacchariphilus polymeriproducens TaxID=1812858 RepID=A0A371AU88_9FIRM|nr:zinc transporter ZupT [Anaerosacchariphilus polymeriproducens]RDU23137.1 zinc transporter ZupT [Anaerosacchariphilus polymeriproducens]
MEKELFAILLTLFAGLATGIGSLFAIIAKKTNTRFLAVSLGFSAGVMIYVSMIEIFQKARESLNSVVGENNAAWLTVISFFGGILLIAIIDKLIPSNENVKEIRRVEELRHSTPEKKLMRMGSVTALAIGIHNFPEGFATFISGLQGASFAIPIAFAIAIHNIPEGIAVSVPIYHATGKRKKAFLYSLLSGLTEPLGALIGYIFLRRFLNDMIFGIVFASVAGIMIFISLNELLPAAMEYGKHELSIYGLIGGMLFIALSLQIFI